METKVYVIDISMMQDDRNILALTDEDFMDISEEQGLVYSLLGFQEMYNSTELNIDATFIRIL